MRVGRTERVSQCEYMCVYLIVCAQTRKFVYIPVSLLTRVYNFDECTQVQVHMYIHACVCLDL